jgi:hypothetical protein
LAARRVEVRLRGVCDARRQRDGARTLGLLNGGERAEAPETEIHWHAIDHCCVGLCLAAVSLHMTFSDLIMFLVIFAGVGLCLAFFGEGYRALRNARRQR